MTIEQNYIANTTLEHRKKYAQFFTPENIAEFMCDWVLEGKIKTRVLEPAYGLGVFSRVLSRKVSLPVDAYEIDNKLFEYAKRVTPKEVNLRNEDYFKSEWDAIYDVIICNPPYLKFHDYDNASYILDVNKHLGTKLNGFTNLYTLFLLKSIAQLKENGRLAYIVPSEFLNSDYGVEVKRALIKSNSLHHIIVVDFTECAFDDALTTACILLCEKKTDSGKVRFSTVTKIEELNNSLSSYLEYDADYLQADKKWKAYYEECNGDKYQNLVPFSNFAKVSRGIATGANEYFTFKPSKSDDYNIPKNSLMPCICKSVDAPHIFFTKDDFENLVNNDKTVYIFNGCSNPKNNNVVRYISLGESLDINRRYLTASRSPWYSIENRPPSPIWVSVFNRSGLRFIRNEAGVYNLTTFHCVYPKENTVDHDILFSYLITDVAKEIFLDNSRQYGNGLVKFEPNDLNKGKVVDLSLLSDDERNYIKDVYAFIRNTMDEILGVKLFNKFFKLKYTNGYYSIDKLVEEFNALKNRNPKVKVKKVVKEFKPRIKQLNLLNLFEQYADSNIVENFELREKTVAYDNKRPIKIELDLSKNVLISLVKANNMEHYMDCSANIYYTGKRFPSTIALNKLYYFVPYIKKKGIRDLYLIKIVRLGCFREGQADEDKNDIRLVFEIEYIKQIFDDYKHLDLKIWRTFTDTTLGQILQ